MTMLRAGWLCVAMLACSIPARAADEPVLHPDHLIVLSTTDLKGKTGPCGCHVPKGGFSRQANYADSLRSSYGLVVWVDAGGYYPEEDTRREAVPFMMS